MATTAASQAKATVHVSVIARVGISIALSLLTAGMMILAFPPANVWPLAFFCLVPMVVAQYRILPLRWAFLAPTFGSTLWVFWLITTLFGFNPDTWYMLAIPVLVVGMSYATTKGTREFHQGTGYRWLVLQGIAEWVGFDMIRSFIPLVRTHGFMGHTLHTQPWLIQPVSIFAVYGLSMLVILLNYALAQAVIALFDRRWRLDDYPAIAGRQSVRWLAGAGIVLAVWVGISLMTLATAPKDLPTVRVAAVQNGILTPGSWDDTPQAVRLQNYVEQTRAAAQQGAQLVVWGELGLGFDPQVEFTDELRALAKETNAHIVIGYSAGVEGGARNAAVMLTPAGEFLDIAGKSHIPPGETAGPYAGAYPIYNTPLGQLGAIICHDANFTDSARILANKGAQLIAIPTLEVYIPGFEKLFHVQTLFRAVENRVPTVKADVAYSSAIVDAYGRILARRSGAPDGEAFALVEDVSLGASNTLYSRLGDWTGWVALAGFVFFMVYPEVIKRRAKETPQAG